MNLSVYDQEYVRKCLSLNINKIKREGRRSLRPPKSITVSEWADANRYLPETSVKPGRWRTSEAPHTRGIMDCVNDPEIRKISIKKSAQWAGTELVNNIIGYFIDVDPTSIIVMQPTDSDAQDYANQKLNTMLQDSPSLRSKISKKKIKDTDAKVENKVLRKKFIGGYLTIVSAYSTSSTRGRSARVTIGDDIDGIEKGGRIKEGDPVDRLMKRTTAYPDDYLHINISTPTRDKESRIDNLHSQSDDRKYYVKCPYCQHQQTMEPEQLVWKKDYDMFGKVTRHYPETVKYQCISCRTLLTESERKAMLDEGVWIATKPWIKHHAGFSGGEVMSKISTMQNVAQQIVDAGADIKMDTDTGKGILDCSKADPAKLEVLINTVFGRVYSQQLGEETDPMELMDRVEDYIDINDVKVPDSVLMLVSAVDVQGGKAGKDPRLEVKVMGYGLDEEAWVIYTGTIVGDPVKKEVWDKLDEFWERKWLRQDGVELEIVRKFIDSGYLSSTVLSYCRGRHREGIFPIKGSTKYDAPILPRHASIQKGGVLLLSLGTQNIKKELFARLNRIKQFGAKYIHFTKCFCNAKYFKEIASEVAVTKSTGLSEYVVYELKDKHSDNEKLDLMVYCFAAMKHAMPDFRRIKENLDAESARLKGTSATEKSYSEEYFNPEPERHVSQGLRRRSSGRSGHDLSSWRYS